MNNDFAKVITPGVIRIERELPKPIEKVWAYLTESEKRARWLAKGEMELVPAGKVRLEFMHSDLSPTPDTPPAKYNNMQEGHGFTGVITKLEPPNLLAFTWQENSEVTFELHETPDAVRLTITHRKLADTTEIKISVCAGWHTHLGILIDVLSGKTPASFWQVHTMLEEQYAERL